VLQRWFEEEWPAWYGPGGPGNAAHDLLAYSSRDRLPVGLVAFLGDELCGIAVLKAESITSHSHLRPWVAAGLVAPPFRNRGIGSALLAALEQVARDLGYSRIYCGTTAAAGLLRRAAWRFMERTVQDGEDVLIYEKAL
jgi:GNAT superfamily N-acetyltransferase